MSEKIIASFVTIKSCLFTSRKTESLFCCFKRKILKLAIFLLMHLPCQAGRPLRPYQCYHYHDVGRRQDVQMMLHSFLMVTFSSSFCYTAQCMHVMITFTLRVKLYIYFSAIQKFRVFSLQVFSWVLGKHLDQDPNSPPIHLPLFMARIILEEITWPMPLSLNTYFQGLLAFVENLY